jgi:uncharacterized membrane protein
MELHEIIANVADGLEAVGVALLPLGLLAAGLRALRPASDAASRWLRIRHDIGRAILLGLEVLIAADIVRTVAFTPTMDTVGTLAAIVAIRTFLSWTLALELDGRWPWQRPAS